MEKACIEGSNFRALCWWFVYNSISTGREKCIITHLLFGFSASYLPRTQTDAPVHSYFKDFSWASIRKYHELVSKMQLVASEYKVFLFLFKMH